jgi:hypothetical protein
MANTIRVSVSPGNFRPPRSLTQVIHRALPQVKTRESAIYSLSGPTAWESGSLRRLAGATMVCGWLPSRAPGNTRILLHLPVVDRAPGEAPTIDFALLADAVQVAGDRIHVLGGGWDTLWTHGFPVSVHSLAIAMRIRVPWTKANDPFVVEIDLEDEDGASVLGDRRVSNPFELGRPPGLPHGSDLGVVWAYTFNHLDLPDSGNYAFTIRIDGRVEQRVRFRVASRHGIG